MFRVKVTIFRPKYFPNSFWALGWIVAFASKIWTHSPDFGKLTQDLVKYK